MEALALADEPTKMSVPFVRFESLSSHERADCRPFPTQAPPEIPPLYPCRFFPGDPFVVSHPALARILDAAQSQG